MDPEKTLARCRLFRDFTDTGLAIIGSACAQKSVPDGSLLFAEAMVGDALYVVQRGKVRVSLKGPDGEPVVLTTLGEGEVLGELSLLHPGGLRVVSAHAEGDLEVLELRQRDFARLQTQKPQACLKLILAIAADLGSRLSESRDLLAQALAGTRR